MYNALMPLPLPKDFKMVAKVVSGSWQEGTGLDMDEYTDQTYEVYSWFHLDNKRVRHRWVSLTWLNEGGDYAESGLCLLLLASDYLYRWNRRFFYRC
jgi:hypothetical protein